MIVGLTGGIGSGKSVVAKILEVLDCKIYNSDDRAKAVYFIPEIKNKVIDLLGEKTYITPNEIDKKYISEKIFSDPNLLQQLNQIIHPAVKHDFELFVSRQNPKDIIIKESAILFETGIYKTAESNILVIAPRQIKTSRIIQRNGLSAEEIESRMNQQWADEKKIPLANHIIYNDEKQALIPQVLQVFNQINP